MANRSILRSIMRYLLAGAAILFLLLLILTGLAYYIAVSDQERAPELVEQALVEQLGGTATFEHYRFRYLEHFPFISLSLEGISLRDPCFEGHGRELLYIREASVQFRPWKLLRREFEVRNLSIDSARIQLYRSADGYFNAGFLEADSLAALRDSSSTLFSIDKIKINGLAFEWEDSLMGKQHRFQLRQARLLIDQRESWVGLHLRGECFFEGLVFKAGNGPFLRQQAARLDLRAEFGRQPGLFRLLPSTLKLATNTLALQGYIRNGAPPHIRVEISSEGILLADARKLLADNLQHGLQSYSISQPLRVDFTLDGPLIPGRPQPLQVGFSTSHATLSTTSIRITDVQLSGRYRNNCDTTGPISPHTDCLDIELLSGRFRDTFPVRLTYHAEDMQAPLVRVKGQVKAPLVQLNGYLPPGQLHFQRGDASVQFSLTGKTRGDANPAVPEDGFRLTGEASIRDAAVFYLPGELQLNGLEANLKFDEKNLQVEYARISLHDEPMELRGWVYDFMPLLLDRPHHLRAELAVDAAYLDFNDFLRHPAETGPARTFIDPFQLAFQVSGKSVRYRKLQASDASFRLQLINAPSSDDMSLHIDSLSARIFEDIPLEGSLRLTQLNDPHLDMGLRIRASLKSFNAMLPGDKLQLGEGQVDLAFRYAGRLNDYFDLKSTALNGRLEGTVQLSNASADYIPRAYAIRHLNGAFHFDEQKLWIDSMSLLLNGNALQGQGQIKGLIPFLFDPSRKLTASMAITTDRLDLNRFPLKPQSKPERGSALRPNRLTKAFEAALNRIEGDFSVRAGTLDFRHFGFTDVAFTGSMLARCAGQPLDNGCVAIDTFSGKLFGNTPIDAALIVRGLDDPFFIADARVSMPMKELNRMFPPDRFAFRGGNIDVAFHYEGQPHDQFDVEHALLKAKLNGSARITGGAIDYKPRGYRLDQMQAELEFGEEGLSVKKLELLLNQNFLRAHGQFYDFLPFLFLPDRELRASLDLYSPHFDFGQFKAPQKYLSRLKKGRYDPNPISELVLAGLEHINLELNVRLDTVSYRNFKAADMVGALRMTPSLLSIQDAGMALADGQFRLDGQITGLEDNAPDIDVRANFQDADIQKAFIAFDNFGQQEMGAENIEGKLTAEATFRARANANYDILPNSMEGRISLKVEDGALIELPALDSIQSFLLRNRNLANIRFATLENVFRLKGQELFFDHFFVASTALAFGVQGRYDLGEGGNTSLLFTLPVGNLFRPGIREDALQDTGDRGKGPAILIRANEDKAGKLNFRLVLSRKEKE